MMKCSLVMSVCLALGIAATCCASDIEKLLLKNQRASPVDFKLPPFSPFLAAQKEAKKGDQAAQEKLFLLVTKQFNSVYSSLKKNDSLLFSMRKVKKDFFDYPGRNYALNLEEYMKKTVGKVRVKKKGFVVKTTEGEEWIVGRLKCDLKADTLVVNKKGSTESQTIPFSTLEQLDQNFIRFALEDELFESKDFKITCDDVEQDEVGKIKDRYLHTTYDGMDRTIVIENKGGYTVNNILIEYQSFAEQKLLGISKDLPEEYRTVGYFKIRSIAPGEAVERKIKVPNVLRSVTESYEEGGIRYSYKYPPNSHKMGEGKIKGLFVKVHRITPYGEHLEKEFKTSGLGSKKWAAVVPLSAKFD